MARLEEEPFWVDVCRRRPRPPTMHAKLHRRSGSGQERTAVSGSFLVDNFSSVWCSSKFYQTRCHLESMSTSDHYSTTGDSKRAKTFVAKQRYPASLRIR